MSRMTVEDAKNILKNNVSKIEFRPHNYSGCYVHSKGKYIIFIDNAFHESRRERKITLIHELKHIHNELQYPQVEYVGRHTKKDMSWWYAKEIIEPLIDDEAYRFYRENMAFVDELYKQIVSNLTKVFEVSEYKEKYTTEIVEICKLENVHI